MTAALNRRSLMLESAEYDAVSALAKKARTPRAFVVQALLAVADEDAVLAKIQELRVAHKVQAQEERKKRQRLAELASGLDLDAIERLIAQVEASAIVSSGEEVSAGSTDADVDEFAVEQD